MRVIPQPELILLPSLAAHEDENGSLFLTQKYLDGVAEFEKLWPGKVTSLITVDKTPNSEMDLVEVDLNVSPPTLERRPTAAEDLVRRLQNVTAVLAHLAPQEAETAELCHQMQVPIVFTSEYTPKTEAQIVDATTTNPVLRVRRKLWIRQAEKTRVHILRNYAAGLQCSGTPTYDHYKALVPDAHLFFDNRVRNAHVISEDDLAAKAKRVKEGNPLRLVFGGRLVAMKGVQDLPKVARALRELNIPFTLDIVGSGPLQESLQNEVSAMGDPSIRLRPAMDFRTGWVPFLREEADLFICCHPQGDPSSTYPEVMSCGTPIVGYDNEAWAGVLRKSGAGWSVPLQDSDALAKKVAELHVARDEVAQMAVLSRDFALEHCFERTEVQRVRHLMQIALPEMQTVSKS
ncbi:glycosyltransferase family 4 protein [uncultured Tateyamaria sp.]|uniref:glycosyltransferase family 4 protein n=1 Tax=uncultured Tateyamaria sp. TaxID=455651 RepID=UPI00260D69E9|nr:glycosyltransferase family 4 protein [uncultured Tateyamaria sp.]